MAKVEKQPHSQAVPVLPSAALAALVAKDTLRFDAGQADTARALDGLIQQISSLEAPNLGRRIAGLFGKAAPSMRGLYIYGGVGRGKTMLMDMFFDALDADTDSSSGAAMLGKWRLHFHDFMVLAQDLIHAARKSNPDDPIASVADQLITRGKIICFDEMEVRDIADAMILARLFTALFDRGAIVVTTSNRHADDLYKDGLHRDRFLPFIALLKDRCEMLEIGAGTDWRGALLAGLPAWFHPNNERARAALNDSFEQISAHMTPYKEIVRVAGRDIVFDTTVGDVAMVSFNDLCDRPLAARDYLAIAGRFTGIVMHDVPAFDAQNDHLARRFMWLIDALYDRGRFFLASAELSVDSLYNGDKWQFEFARTQSRLREMAARGKSHIEASDK
jgi:cell division protein ZapE